MNITENRIKIVTIGLILLVSFFSCVRTDSNTIKMDKRTPITSLEQANKFVSDNFDKSEETLWISESLNDPVGMNMAIVLDGILKLGNMPDGFEQKEGYRIYKKKKKK